MWGHCGLFKCIRVIALSWLLGFYGGAVRLHGEAISDALDETGSDTGSVASADIPSWEYKRAWLEAKRSTIALLEKLANAPQGNDPIVGRQTRDWLLDGAQGEKSRFQILAEDLRQSALDMEPAPGTPCGLTADRPHSVIQLPMEACGTLRARIMNEILVGAAVRHQGMSEEFSIFAAVDTLNLFEARQSDPGFVILDRYKGELNNKTVRFYHGQKGMRLEGAPVNLSQLPALRGSAGGFFRTGGEYSSFTCTTRYFGFGKTPDGKLGYGELTNPSPIHSRRPLNAWVTIDASRAPEILTLSLRYDIDRGDCTTDLKQVSLTLVYEPPTEEELRIKRIESNSQRLTRVLAGSSLGADDRNEIMALLETRELLPQAYVEALPELIARGEMELARAAVDNRPNISGGLNPVLKTLMAGNSAQRVSDALAIEGFAQGVAWNSAWDDRTPLGHILDDPSRYRRYEEWERFAAQLTTEFIRAGADPTADVSKFSNRPRKALNLAVATFAPSLLVIKALLEELTPEQAAAPDERDRSAVDYLKMHWVIFKDSCAQVASSAAAKARYNAHLDNYRAVNKALIDKGVGSERRGCLYYAEPICRWDGPTSRFLLSIRTEYRATRPRFGPALRCG